MTDKIETPYVHPSDLKPHLFKPGQSGNPKGRPPNRWHRQIRDVIKERIPELVANLFAQAANGEIHASKLLLDKVLPNMKSCDMPAGIDLSKIASGSAYDLMNISADLINAVNSDEIESSIATDRMNMIEQHRKLIEVDCVQRALEEVKNKLEMTN